MHTYTPLRMKNTHTAWRHGFTSIEMVTVMAAISVIAAMTIVAINPSLQYKNTYDAVRKNNADFLRNTFTEHFNETRTLYGQERLNTGKENALPICVKGQSDDYCIPVDIDSKRFGGTGKDPYESCPQWMGYSVYLISPTVADVFPTHLGRLSPAPSDPKCGYVAVQGVDVSQSGGNTQVTEGGVTDTILFRLAKAPASPVTITVTPASVPSSQIITDKPKLTFTPQNWGIFQTITVTAIDDPDIEGPHTSSIAYAVTSSDASYNGKAVTATAVAITDNDSATIVIKESNNSTDVTEGGTTDTYAVQLGGRPKLPVSVTPATDITQLTLSSGVTPLVFDYNTWNIPQTVTVTAVDDVNIEGTQTKPVTHAVTTADTQFLGVTGPAVNVHITDNDAAQFVVTGGPNTITEAAGGNHSWTMNVALQGKPALPVYVAIANDPQVTTDKVSLVFTSLNWNVPQPVIVTAVDDQIAEGSPHIGVTTLSVSPSSDVQFVGVTLPVNSSMTDNDVAGTTIVESGGATTVTEGGATDTYTVVLNTQPRAAVTVTVTPDAQLTVAATPPLPLVFTAANWNIPQTVTVAAVNNTVVDGSRTGTITHTATSADLYYQTSAGLVINPVTVNIIDDEYGIVASGTALTASEDGTVTDSYGLKLSRQPTGNVKVDVAVDASGPLGQQLSLDSALQNIFTRQLVFNSSNWNNPQTVNVRAIDDSYTEAPTHTSTITAIEASGPKSWTDAPLVTASITDNDAIGVNVSTSAVALSEATPAVQKTYTLALNSRPTGTVVVNVQSLNTATGVTVSPATLTFSNSNWNASQTVTVTVVDDAVDEADQHTSVIAHSINSASTADAAYKTLTGIAGVTANITDNDTAGLVLAPTSSTRNEADGDTSYTVHLRSQPVAPVTLTVTPDSQLVRSAPAGGTLTFSTANWQSDQTVQLRAVADFIDKPDQYPGVMRNVVTATADPKYLTLSGSYVMTINDDDVAGVSVQEIAAAGNATIDGVTAVTEGGTTDRIQLKLNSEPTGPVTIAMASSGSRLSFSPATLTFNPSGADMWSTYQIVTVTAVDDTVAEGPMTDYIRFAATSTDAHYQNKVIPPVSVSVTDNDKGLIFTNVPVNVAEQNATSDTYQVRLSEAPVGTVTFNIRTPDGQTTVNPSQITFSPSGANIWSANKTITVTAVDDDSVEGNHAGIIRHSYGSGDTLWNGVVDSNVIANITDNDFAGLLFDKTTVSVTESGTKDAYTVQLGSRPSAPVTVTIGSSTQLNTDVQTLTFPAAGWNIPQIVNVSAVDDLLVEGVHSATLTHTVTSADPFFSLVPAANVTATITDNDSYGITLNKATANVTEGGAPDSYTIVLRTPPTANVDVRLDCNTLAMQVDGKNCVDPTLTSVHTFTPANWNTPQTVSIVARDNSTDDIDPVTDRIAHTLSSTDTNYNGVPTGNIAVDIHDNDTAGLAITPVTLSMSEGGTTKTYTVKLNSQPFPASPVTVTPTPEGQTSVSPAALTFTSANWNTPQTVTVTAIDDQNIEGTQTEHIIHAIGSSDFKYSILIAPTVTVTIADNDTAGVLVNTTSRTAYEAGTPTAYTTYSISLNAKPASNVVLTPTRTPASQFSLSQNVLTFTPANWSAPQVVTITATDDSIFEGTNYGAIAYDLTTSDANYTGIVVPSISVKIMDNDPDVAVSIGGTDIPMQTGSIDFGSVTAGTATPPQRTITVKNVGSGNLILGTPTLPAGFSVVTGFSAAATTSGLVPGTSTTLVIKMDSVTAGTYNGKLSFSTNVSSKNPYDFTVKGAVTPAPAPDIEVYGDPIDGVPAIPDGSVLPYDFGYSNAGVTITRTFTIVNTGQAKLDISSLTVPVGFSIVQPITPTSILAGDPPATFIIRWNASSPNFQSGPLRFTTNVPGAKNPYNFIIQASSDPAKAPEIDVYKDSVIAGNLLSCTAGVSPAVDFGPTPIGNAVDHTFFIKNSGVYALRLSTLGFLSGTDFSFSSAFGNAVMQPGDVKQFIARFSANGTDRTDRIIIGNNDANESPCSFNITGNSAAPLIQVTDDTSTTVLTGGSSTVNFGTTSIGVPKTHTFTVKNLGDDTLALNQNISVPNGYQIVSPWSATVNLAPGASTGFVIRLTAAAIGSFSGPVHITSNDAPRSPFDFTVTGTVTPTPGIIMTETEGTTKVQEGGDITKFTAGATLQGSDCYYVTLNTAPTKDVTVNVSNPDSHLNFSKSSVTLTSTDWSAQSAAHYVCASAINDFKDEGVHTANIIHSVTTTDPVYSTQTAANVNVSITDNDVAGFTLTQSDGSTTVLEGGDISKLTQGASVQGTDCYSITLNTVPDQPVTVTTSNPTAKLNFSRTSITLDATNWNAINGPTTSFCVNAKDDDIAEGNHYSAIIHTVTTTDAKYGSLTPAGVSVGIGDNDVPGVLIDQSDGITQLYEGGGTFYSNPSGPGGVDFYNVTLSSQPTADVQFSIASQYGKVNFSPSLLTFTSQNWNVPQRVTVTVIDNAVKEAVSPYTDTMYHGIASTDPNYTSANLGTMPTVLVSIFDNDFPGVVLTPFQIGGGPDGSNYVVEGDAANEVKDAYSIRLQTQPTDDVNVYIDRAGAAAGQVIFPAAMITITPATWNQDHFVVIGAVNDSVVEPQKTITIAHETTSTDPNYNVMSGIPPMSITVGDDDVDTSPKVVQTAIVTFSGQTRPSYACPKCKFSEWGYPAGGGSTSGPKNVFTNPVTPNNVIELSYVKGSINWGGNSNGDPNPVSCQNGSNPSNTYPKLIAIAQFLDANGNVIDILSTLNLSTPGKHQAIRLKDWYDGPQIHVPAGATKLVVSFPDTAYSDNTGTCKASLTERTP
ncbi:MAG: hypothetical protein JWM56_23 [Candidatus Peribacteria bacterium]|nr:hypothetical protein [Candidatus Peribacteria bacterium]